MCYVLICNVQCGIYCRGFIFAMCSYTPVIRNVLCAYMQCAGRAVCTFAMCSFTPAMCNALCALCCVQRGIYCVGAESEIDFAIIFNGVITSGYLLDAQQQMDIVKK